MSYNSLLSALVAIMAVSCATPPSLAPLRRLLRHSAVSCATPPSLAPLRILLLLLPTTTHACSLTPTSLMRCARVRNRMAGVRSQRTGRRWSPPT